MKKMSEKGRKLLSEWEGVELEVYKDSAGHDTIGIGHLITRSERDLGTIVIAGTAVAYRDGLTREQALSLLAQDLRRFEEAVGDAVSVSLSQNQFDALVSFAFNVGIGNFKRSTLLRLLNQGQRGEVPAQLRRWNKAGGRVVRGLVNRREKEIALWNGGR